MLEQTELTSPHAKPGDRYGCPLIIKDLLPGCEPATSVVSSPSCTSGASADMTLRLLISGALWAFIAILFLTYYQRSRKLEHIHGPWWASFSTLPLIFALMNGDLSERLAEISSRHGSLASRWRDRSRGEIGVDRSRDRP